jgi:hypothetical protein
LPLREHACISFSAAFRAARLMPMPAVIGENDVSYENGFYSSRSVTSRAQ